MKGARIVQIFFLLVVIAYLIFFHFANPITVELPLLNRWLEPIAVSYVVSLLFLLGWLIGSVTSRLGVWAGRREQKKLEQRIAELEANLARSQPTPVPYQANPAVPVIPDRDTETQYQGEDPTTA